MTEPQRFLGKYQILDELGRGMFATVYRARDSDLGRQIALKVLHPLLTHDPLLVARFRREAQAMAWLDHPRVVAVYEIGQSESALFIAMKLIEGGSLAQRLASDIALPWPNVLRITGQIAEALDYAHDMEVLHCDLKPANVLLDSRIGAVLTDFGFARLVVDNSSILSQSGSIVGTPAYVAPEIWEGKATSRSTDIYALGCIVYELVTGQSRFRGDNLPATMWAHFRLPLWPSSWPEGTPRGLADVLGKALMQDPEARYATAGALVDALAALHSDSLATPRKSLEPAALSRDRQSATPQIAEIDTRASVVRDLPGSALDLLVMRPDRTYPTGPLDDHQPDEGTWLWKADQVRASLLVEPGLRHGEDRSKNQDSVMVRLPEGLDPSVDSLQLERFNRRGVLLVVADGGASEKGGQLISQSVADGVSDFYYSAALPQPLLSSAFVLELLVTALEAQNNVWVGWNSRQSDGERSYTTCVCAAIVLDCVHVAWVGDSQAFLIRDGQVWQQTEPTYWDPPRKAPWAIGDPRINEDVIRTGVWPLEPDDTVLLCSDGLIRAVTPQRVAAVVSSKADTREAVKLLFREADNPARSDDTSFIIARRVASAPRSQAAAKPAPSSAESPTRSSLPGAWIPRALVLLAVVALAVACLALVLWAPTIIPEFVNPSAATTVVFEPTFTPPATATAVQGIVPPLIPTDTPPLAPMDAPTATLTLTTTSTATPMFTPADILAATVTPTPTPTRPPTSTPTPTWTAVPPSQPDFTIPALSAPSPGFQYFYSPELRLLFSWSPPPSGNTETEIQVEHDEGGGNWRQVFTRRSAQASIDVPVADFQGRRGLLRWQVRMIQSSTGQGGSWSQPWEFRIDDQPPSPAPTRTPMPPPPEP